MESNKMVFEKILSMGYLFCGETILFQKCLSKVNGIVDSLTIIVCDNSQK
jgi:hypothetical protein